MTYPTLAERLFRSQWSTSRGGKYHDIFINIKISDIFDIYQDQDIFDKYPIFLIFSKLRPFSLSFF